MREQGLSPRPLARGIDCGYRRLDVNCAKAVTMTLEETDICLAAIEVDTTLEHPVHGSATIHEVITREGESIEAALQRCADSWMDVTFPALRSLFDGKLAPGAGTADISTYTEGLGTIRWQVYTGKLQFAPQDASLDTFLRRMPPLGQVLDTLCGNFLSDPRLHWCTVSASMRKKGLDVNCVIDGVRPRMAADEMHEKLSGERDLPRSWEFCQFALMHPAGPAHDMEAELLRHHKERFGDPEPEVPRRGKSWGPWSRRL
jgi:hypothetical protein